MRRNRDREMLRALTDKVDLCLEYDDPHRVAWLMAECLRALQYLYPGRPLLARPYGWGSPLAFKGWGAREDWTELKNAP